MLLDKPVQAPRHAVKPRLMAASVLQQPELALVVLLTLIGLVLRVWQLSSAGLDHFDEGAYVLSGLGLFDPTQPHRLYPDQFKFAPLVYPLFIGLSYLLLGHPSDTAALLVSVGLGSLTVPAVWWVGRAWFGRAAGIAAAALVALNEFHIGLSRTALTDIPFTLFLLIALAAIAHAVAHPRFRYVLLAGLATGLAWNTKYHGWFALVISALALAPYLWNRRRRGFSMRPAIVTWFGVAIVAMLCAIPWALFIQSQPGGYVGLLDYQHSLFSDNWARALWSQIQMQQFLDGPLDRLGPPIALLCAVLVTDRRVQPTPRFVLLLALICSSAAILGGFPTVVGLTLIAIPILVREPKLFPGWLVVSWLAVWAVMTPFYHPYARLVLPFTIASSLAAGVALARVAGSRHEWLPESGWRPVLAGLGATAVALCVTALPRPADPWRPARSIPDAAAAMSQIIPAGSRVIVIGEPELAFYFQLSGRPAFERTEHAADLQAVQESAYVVAGVYARRAPALRDALAGLGARLVPVGSYSMDPNDVRLLDDFSIKDAGAFRAAPDNTFALTLYRLDPPVAATANDQ
jgi:4-amino-4-deoxy-L-arabinose transferase-like glycosyltransferase